MPTPFGWNPADFWVTFLTLGGTALLMVIGIPISFRASRRLDRSERERVAAVLRELAATLGGEFIGPRKVMRIDEEGDEFGPADDYGTALAVSSGMAVEAGVEVQGALYGRSLRLWVAVPPGRSWAVDRLEARAWRWPGGEFGRRYRCANPDRLSRDARAALLDLLRHVEHVELDAAGLTVWALPPRWTQRGTQRVYSIIDAARLVPHVHRTAAAARLLLRD
jgi:hypothetical protein